jgi:hypothetical protein
VSEGPPLWDFASGGTLTLTGAVPTLGLPAGTVLLAGTFIGTPNEVIGNDFGLFLSIGIDTKNETLAAFFGLPTDFTAATTSIQGSVTTDANGAFSGTVVNADLNNLSAVGVPMPATLWLILLGGLALLRPRSAA